MIPEAKPQGPPTILRYGAPWPADFEPIEIEMECIRNGGKWKLPNGSWAGMGLFHHFKALDKILWPKAKWHRWHELLLRSCVDHRMVGIMGPADSGKSNMMARWALLNYFVWPDEITILASSTDLRGLELRIWGEIKKYWRSAKKLFPQCPGNILEARIMITTEGIGDEEARDFRNGIVGIPCIVNNNFVGLGRYAGIKNKRIMLIGDELQFMLSSFLDAIANLNKPNFRCVVAGNPKDPTDSLGKFCEPSVAEGGWEGVDQTEKTKTWRTKFPDGICVNLVGTDSPNMDVAEDQPIPFPFLISRQQIKDVIEFYGKDSLQYWMQCVGMMRQGAVARRVITKMLCRKFHAMEPPDWEGDKTKVIGLDAAYGNVGGDRCALVELHFGNDPRGLQLISVADRPVIVPVTVKFLKLQEDQISEYVMNYAKERGIPPEHVFYDATGRGTLAMSFARTWSNAVTGIEFGGKASERPISKDKLQTKCRDLYGNFVTELWFSSRVAIESGQMRNMPDEIVEEGILREWELVQGNKIQVEPKQDTKLKLGRSPDLYDAFVTALEGARRLGFQINALGGEAKRLQAQQWLQHMRERFRSVNRSKTLRAA